MLDPFALVGNTDDNDNDSSHDDQDEKTVGDQESTECLRRLQWASEQRLQWRKEGGSLESIGPYELPDMSVKAWPSPDEPDGWGVGIVAIERYAASRIVTELMLLANEAVATYGDANGIPMPFRSQEMTEISDLELDGTPVGPCRSWLAIRSTRRSQIMSSPEPHCGLGLDYYVQSTSPVRRYADLALHHQLKAHLRGDELPFPANDGADTDIVRLAQDGGKVSRLLERSSNDHWLREFLRRRGAEPTAVLVLSGDGWKPDMYKIHLPELGAIMTYRSSRPLDIGAQFDLPSNTLSEFV
jgi:exoribonuclease-2